MENQNKEQGKLNQPRHIRFDGTITFGNILSLVAMIGTIITLWRNIETRVIIVEERVSVQTKSLERVIDQVERLAVAQSAMVPAHKPTPN